MSAMRKNKRTVFFILVLSVTLLLASTVFASVKTLDANSYNWTKNAEEWCCTDENGDPVSGWILYNDDTYYLDRNGIMKTGWIKYKNSWYYLDEGSGKLQKEQWIDNYYVNENGKMSKIR